MVPQQVRITATNSGLRDLPPPPVLLIKYLNDSCICYNLLKTILYNTTMSVIALIKLSVYNHVEQFNNEHISNFSII